MAFQGDYTWVKGFGDAARKQGTAAESAYASHLKEAFTGEAVVQLAERGKHLDAKSRLRPR